jgi:hypothetical protein
MDSYSSKHLLTGRQLRELRKKGLSSPERRRPWSARNADLIKPAFAAFDGDRDGKLSKAEFRDLLASINGHLSDRKVRAITEVLADGAESVDVASLAERVADNPEQSRYLVAGMRGLRFSSGETIFHTDDPSDFVDPPAAGRKNRVDRWKDHGDIFAWGDGYFERPASPEPRRAPASRRKVRGSQWTTTASDISATIGPASRVVPTAGSSTATVWKERNQFDCEHRRLRPSPRQRTPATTHRLPTWGDEHGVMPRTCPVPYKVLTPTQRPPPPPAAAIPLL